MFQCDTMMLSQKPKRLVAFTGSHDEKGGGYQGQQLRHAWEQQSTPGGLIRIH